MIKLLRMEHIKKDVPTREIPFYEGLNIILAERGKGSTKKGSRNGVGKSTLIEIIDFCLGADPDKDSTLPTKPLQGWTFTLDMDIQGQPLCIRRSCDEPKKIFVKGELKGCPISSSLPPDLGTGELEYDVKQWKLILGWALFNINPRPDANDDLAKNGPKYESLISHFIRKVFDNPLSATPGELRSRTEMAVTYLLGLDVLFLQYAKLAKKERNDIERRRSAAVDQSKQWVRDIQLLKSECERMKQDLERRKVLLEQFTTKDEIASINESLAELTMQYHTVISRKTANARKLKAARNSREISFLPFDSVKKIYEDAGALFKEETLNHMAAVKTFHDRLQANYTMLLDRQISRLGKEIEEDDKLIEHIDAKRQQIIAAQNAQTAFEEYSKLQDNLTATQSELAVKEDCLQRYADTKDALDENTKQREKLIAEARTNHMELKSIWSAEEKFFKDFITLLYDEADDVTLGIEITDGDDFGISYAPHFSSDRSMGKRKLKTLGFDLTLFHHQRIAKLPIDFMIHDSVLYESSDSRQFATALLFIDKLCKETGSQYITVLNSDDAQNDDFKSAIPFDKLKSEYVKGRELSDTSPSEKLMGMNF